MSSMGSGFGIQRSSNNTVSESFFMISQESHALRVYDIKKKDLRPIEAILKIGSKNNSCLLSTKTSKSIFFCEAKAKFIEKGIIFFTY